MCTELWSTGMRLKMNRTPTSMTVNNYPSGALNSLPAPFPEINKPQPPIYNPIPVGHNSVSLYGNLLF